MRCRHRLPYSTPMGNGEKGGLRKYVGCIPADYPPRVRSGYTAFGHSDSIQANKSQAIIMRMRTRHLRPAIILLRFKPFSLDEGLRRGNNLLGFPHSADGWSNKSQSITMRTIVLLSYFRSGSSESISTQPADKLLSNHLDRPAGSRLLCSDFSVPPNYSNLAYC